MLWTYWLSGPDLRDQAVGKGVPALEDTPEHRERKEEIPPNYFGPAMLQLGSADGKLTPEETVVPFINQR